MKVIPVAALCPPPVFVHSPEEVPFVLAQHRLLFSSRPTNQISLYIYEPLLYISLWKISSFNFCEKYVNADNSTSINLMLSRIFAESHKFTVYFVFYIVKIKFVHRTGSIQKFCSVCIANTDEDKLKNNKYTHQ